MSEHNLNSKDISTLFNNTLKQLESFLKNKNPVTITLPVIKDSLNKKIEHTLLKIDATDNDVTKLCTTAMEYNFRAVCCMPRDTKQCSTILKSSGVLTVQVIDFPLGMGSDNQRIYEAEQAVLYGADEIDMLLDVRAVQSDRIDIATRKIQQIISVCGNKPVKVILETSVLSDKEIVKGCAAAYAGGASFVKTSTGFGKKGASIKDIKIMKAAVLNRMRIKAAGGIKTVEFVQKLLNAGADVIGTSDGPGCLMKI